MAKPRGPLPEPQKNKSIWRVPSLEIAPHKNSIRRNAAPLTQIPPRTVSEGYQARKRTAVVSRSRAETLYEDNRRINLSDFPRGNESIKLISLHSADALAIDLTKFT